MFIPCQKGLHNKVYIFQGGLRKSDNSITATNNEIVAGRYVSSSQYAADCIKIHWVLCSQFYHPSCSKNLSLFTRLIISLTHTHTQYSSTPNSYNTRHIIHNLLTQLTDFHLLQLTVHFLPCPDCTRILTEKTDPDLFLPYQWFKADSCQQQKITQCSKCSDWYDEYISITIIMASNKSFRLYAKRLDHELPQEANFTWN